MFINILLGILVMLVIVSPFLIQLSIFSLKYYAALYHITPQNLDLFLSKLPTVLRIFYSCNLKSIYFRNTKHTPEQIILSLRSQRILTTILPAMFIFAGGVGLIQAILKRDNLLMFGYCLLIFSLLAATRTAWYFGHRLREV